MLILHFTRCISLPTHDPDFSMDNPIVPRSVKHTRTAVENFEMGVLWDEYGLICTRWCELVGTENSCTSFLFRYLSVLPCAVDPLTREYGAATSRLRSALACNYKINTMM